MLVLVLGGYIFLIDRRHFAEQEDFSRPKVMPRLADRVSRFRMERGDFILECRKEQGVWRIIEPIEARADSGYIERLLIGLETFEQGQVITTDDLKKSGLTFTDYGLDLPRIQLAFEGRGFTQTVSIGRDVPGSGALFLAVDDVPSIVTTNSDLMALLPEQVDELRDRRLFHRDPARVNRVEINTQDGFLRIVRRDDGSWVLRQPIEARADTRGIEELIGSIMSWRVEHYVTDDVSDKAVYGLDEPAGEVSFAFGPDGFVRTLQIGTTVDGDDSLRYVMIRNESSVMAMLTADTRDLRVRVDELRDRRLVTFPEESIHGIRVSRGDRVVELWSEKEQWQITSPRNWLAAKDRIAALLNDFKGNIVLAFSPIPEDDETETEFWEIAFFRKQETSASDEDQQKPSLVLRTDRRLSNAGHLILRRDDDQWLYHVAPEILKHVSLQPVYYRDPVLLQISENNVSYVEITRDDRKQRIDRIDDQKFRPVLTDETVSASLMPNAGLFSQLANLTALEMFMAEERDMATYGLDEPRAVVTVGLRGDSGISKTILIGKQEEDGTGYYARIRGQEVIAILSEHTVKTLTSDLFVVVSESEEGNDNDAEEEPAT